MPKVKTKAGAKKRFKLTGSGKLKRKHAFKSHILTKKETKQITTSLKKDVTSTTKLIKNKTVPALSPLIFEINDMEFNSQLFPVYHTLAY